MRVALRPVEDADLPLFYRDQLDPVASAMADVPSRDRAAFDEHWARIRADPRTVLRTIVAEGEVVGNLVCWGPPDDRRVGYWIARAAWGRGIATGALALFLDVVPERPLLATVAPHNAGSARVLEKCGFVRSACPPPEPGLLVFERT